MRIRLNFMWLPVILLMAGTAQGQERGSLQAVQHAYEQFDYAQTTRLARSLLAGRDSLPRPERIAVLTLKGVAEYTLGQEDSAKASFISLLTVDATTTLDANAYSPKIIEFFDQVKHGYRPAGHSEIALTNSSLTTDSTHSDLIRHIGPTTYLKSVVLPGWGQLSLDSPGSSTKGWLFGSAAVVAIASSIYYITETNHRESDYLSQTGRAGIATTYDEYSTAYTKRNISLIAFAAIWTAAQIDLIYFSSTGNAGTVGVRFVPLGSSSSAAVITAQYSF